MLARVLLLRRALVSAEARSLGRVARRERCVYVVRYADLLPQVETMLEHLDTRFEEMSTEILTRSAC